MALEKVMCPFCERDVDEHEYRECLINLRFLASGTLEYQKNDASYLNSNKFLGMLKNQDKN